MSDWFTHCEECDQKITDEAEAICIDEDDAEVHGFYLCIDCHETEPLNEDEMDTLAEFIQDLDSGDFVLFLQKHLSPKQLRDVYEENDLEEFGEDFQDINNGDQSVADVNQEAYDRGDIDD